MVAHKITNIKTNKVYIGQTKSKNVERYVENHFISALKNNDNHRYFYRAIRKYGRDYFKWEIIDHGVSKKHLDNKERYYIILYKSNNNQFGYNITAGGDKTDSFTNNPDKEEIREKHRQNALKGKTLKNKGRDFSEEYREKISISLKGRISEKKGKTYEEIYGDRATEERRKRIIAFTMEECKDKQSNSAKQRWDKLSEIDRKAIGRKISNSKKGKTSHFKGKTYEEIYGIEKAKEIRKKTSESSKGKHTDRKGKTYEEIYGDRAEEVKQKMISSNKGKKREPMKEEIKRKISQANRGQIAWNKGLTKEIDPRLGKSKEAREKISKKLKGNQNGRKK